MWLPLICFLFLFIHSSCQAIGEEKHVLDILHVTSNSTRVIMDAQRLIINMKDAVIVVVLRPNIRAKINSMVLSNTHSRINEGIEQEIEQLNAAEKNLQLDMLAKQKEENEQLMNKTLTTAYDLRQQLETLNKSIVERPGDPNLQFDYILKLSQHEATKQALQQQFDSLVKQQNLQGMSAVIREVNHEIYQLLRQFLNAKEQFSIQWNDSQEIDSKLSSNKYMNLTMEGDEFNEKTKGMKSIDIGVEITIHSIGTDQ